MKKGKILIVDDNEDILFTLKMLLRPLAEQVTTLDDPREMLPLLSRVRHDVILLDMNFRRDAVSGREGFAWLEEILKLDPQAVVIFITAYSDTEKAVQAIKQGATDFIPKPWQNDKLLATVSAALQLSFSRHEVTVLKEQRRPLNNVPKRWPRLPNRHASSANRPPCRLCYRPCASARTPMPIFCSWAKTVRARTCWPATSTNSRPAAVSPT